MNYINSIESQFILCSAISNGNIVDLMPSVAWLRRCFHLQAPLFYLHHLVVDVCRKKEIQLAFRTLDVRVEKNDDRGLSGFQTTEPRFHQAHALGHAHKLDLWEACQVQLQAGLEMLCPVPQ